MLQNSKEFRQKILIDPVLNGADKLRIVSGYAAHTMVSWHISELWNQHNKKFIDIDLIVGMCCRDKLFRPVHEGFKDIMKNGYMESKSKFTCKYIVDGSPVHTKLYLWEKKGEPFCAYTGSANYTQPAFFGRHREFMTEYDPSEAAEYINSLESDSMFCNHADIEEKIIITERPQNLIMQHDIENEKLSAVEVQGMGVEKICLSLLASSGPSKGNTPPRSGINWGQRGTRNKDEAYIHIPKKIAVSGFFPERGEHFTVLTDDNISLTLTRGQDNGKGMTTPDSNARLGEYLRNRLGLPDGAFVTRKDLERYGRTDIVFYKIDDEHYFMDFSKPEGD